MKYLSEFRDPILADKLVNELKKDVGLLSSGNNVRIEYPAQTNKNISVKKSKFSIEFRN